MKPACSLCKGEIRDPEDSFCYGCRSHICERCDIQYPSGNHSPSDHFENPADEPEEA